MKFEVTEKGVFDNKGERIEVGTVLDINGDDVPSYLLNKGQIPSGNRAAVTNPAAEAIQELSNGYSARSSAPGWFVIAKDGVDLTKSLRQSDIVDFSAMSDEDQTAFLEENKKAAE